MYRFSRLVLLSFLLVLVAGCGAETGANASTPAASDTAPTRLPAATAAPTASDTAPTRLPAATAAPTLAATSRPAATSAPTPATDTHARIQLRTVAKDLKAPVFVTHANADDSRLFVVEKAGTIAILRDGQRAAQPFLDISALIKSSGSEQGLLGLAFHPDYQHNGRFFVYYTDTNGDDTLARYQVSDNPDVADPASSAVLFVVPDPAPNHNGGMLAFGPDGYLYVGLGDGGSGGDPWGNGQNRDVLLGKLLRLDVDKGDPYAIPADNPWPDEDGVRGEIWSYGLRNPWRFSFDRATGDLYIGDVGQNQYEEIDVQPAGTPGGRNYGWNTREGLHCYGKDTCDSNGMTDPVAEYTHSEGCSVTGGYVYRGAASPSLQGAYIFGDYCSGTIWALRQSADKQWERSTLLDSKLSISSFGEDAAGELYVLDLNGALYQILASED